MDKKLKKNSFIQGTLIASLALIFIKVLGAVYVIPFYRIVGEDGGTLYSYAYSIYNLFLNISTAGIPVAMSMIISEYLSLEMYDAKERSYKVGKYMVLILAIVSFSLVFFGSDFLAKFILSNKTDGHSIEDVSLVIKSISFCLLIIPFLSVLRGYLQGHKYISSTSFAQVIEQVVRILVVILGSYVSIKIYKSSIPIGVSIALSGTFFGGLFAYVYLRRKISNNKKAFPLSDKRNNISNMTLAKKILTYCIPLVIIAVTDNLYTLIDIKLIIKGLNMVGYNTLTAETISSILSTWSPKICAVIAAISVALTTNIIPHVTSYFVCKDYKNVMEKVNQAISTVLIITIPMATLLFLLSNEAYFIFYGNSEYGPLILKTTAIIHVFFSVNAVLTSSLQAMKKFKTIYLNTFIGLLTNACMDIPMILLLHKLGLPSFIGTSLATCIGYTVSISMSLIYLRKNLNFNYKNVLKTLVKTLLPFVCLLVPVLLSKIFIKYEYNYLTSFISLIVHGLLGMCLYLFVIYKNGNLSDVFGREYVNRLLKKFHLIKEKHE